MEGGVGAEPGEFAIEGDFAGIGEALVEGQAQIPDSAVGKSGAGATSGLVSVALARKAEWEAL